MGMATVGVGGALAEAKRKRAGAQRAGPHRPLAAERLGGGDLRLQLGDGVVDSYVKLRKAHLADFSRQVSPWEREQYLDA